MTTENSPATPMPPAVEAPPSTTNVLRFAPGADGRVRLRTGDVAVLAELTGIERSYVSRMVVGARKPPAHVRQQLEQVLGVSLDKVDAPRGRRLAVG